MKYQVKSALWGGVFAVPGAIVDEHLRSCPQRELKVMLALLRAGGKAGANDIADALGESLGQVREALEYWVRAGVLSPGEIVPPQAMPKLEYTSEPTRESAPPAKPAYAPGSSRRKLTPRQINELSREDKNVAFLLQESQMILGKPLTPIATDTLASLYSYYGMNPEVILMLLQYCIAQGKDNMRYVEKVAASWLEAGIDTHEKAEREIVKAASRGKFENIIRRLFGITDRELIASERAFLSEWKEQELSVELIELAYERTIEQKGKLSFAYINGILQNWRAKGIVTPEQALGEMRGGKKSEPHRQSGQVFKYGDIL